MSKTHFWLLVILHQWTSLTTLNIPEALNICFQHICPYPVLITTVFWLLNIFLWPSKLLPLGSPLQGNSTIGLPRIALLIFEYSCSSLSTYHSKKLYTHLTSSIKSSWSAGEHNLRHDMSICHNYREPNLSFQLFLVHNKYLIMLF